MAFGRFIPFTALVAMVSGCGLFAGQIDSVDLNAVEYSEPQEIVLSTETQEVVPTTETQEVVPTRRNTESVTSYTTFPGQNSLINTDGDLDVAIVGSGFFMVRMNDEIALTRSGNLSRNGEGNLIVGPPENSLLLLPECHLPADGHDFSISEDGRLSMLLDGKIIEACQLQLYRVPDRHQLLEVRPNLYLETEESGVAKTGVPGRDGFGSLRHRVLEADVQVSLFPEYNTLDRRPRAVERQFPLPSTAD